MIRFELRARLVSLARSHTVRLPPRTSPFPTAPEQLLLNMPLPRTRRPGRPHESIITMQAQPVN
jgi:hypothetical protein